MLFRAITYLPPHTLAVRENAAHRVNLGSFARAWGVGADGRRADDDHAAPDELGEIARDRGDHEIDAARVDPIRAGLRDAIVLRDPFDS
jgi:hypothetical protein